MQAQRVLERRFAARMQRIGIAIGKFGRIAEDVQMAIAAQRGEWCGSAGGAAGRAAPAYFSAIFALGAQPE
jgi:hypothetical protein